MRYILFLCFLIIFISCKHIDVYEKQVDLPQHEWRKNQNAVIPFNISDSTYHQLFFVVRHTQRFPFNRLLVKLLVQDTAKKTIKAMHVNLPLTDTAGDWNGIMMDDIYYSRIKINPPVFLKPGAYRFVLQHTMKEEILSNILNVGIALDK
ncbi:gliding motility lipoprotein GldH [Niabella ginsengisoli]|uniref:Gliding motility lipoprotein GldH n=1 Tax=Niabella ginsengisoli TaxID=522298 RepID=A0ABS9SNZ8_9BACT|nr:gliding motility lipoprotein GldH [Niabella ginsengisoli]MCH5600085.1 gliding motility lipoprotein GldH [Niabella ginsengisoli]